MIKLSIKHLGLLFGLFACVFLVGCGSSDGGNNNFSLDVFGFQLDGKIDVNLKQIPIRIDDAEEITDLYQEVGDNLKYTDSLLIAKKYSKGVGANAFIQDNLEILQNNGLELANIKTTQVGLKKNDEKINAVLLEYEIIGGLIENIPLLYISQFFIPYENEMILISFITEDSSVRSDVSNLFKNIE